MGYYKKSTELLSQKKHWTTHTQNSMEKSQKLYIVEENENVIILCIMSDSLPPAEL